MPGPKSAATTQHNEYALVTVAAGEEWDSACAGEALVMNLVPASALTTILPQDTPG